MSTTKRNAHPTPDEKSVYVRTLFDNIAPYYDRLNAVLSLCLHHRWRRAAVRQADIQPGDTVLDVCTGTGDLAFELVRYVGEGGAVYATDFSAPILAVAERKKGVQANVHFSLADTQALPFPDNHFDAATVGFGIRNVAEVALGIAEMARVVRPGGRVVILEFNQPINPLFACLYRFYSFRVIPFVGGLLSGRRSAYVYLPESVKRFHSRAEITGMLEAVGMGDVRVTNLLFGAVVIHCAVKSGEKK
jgi:demethylmenaquinone methyltransferase/2-methoxy-6-polyprenyl-1,4-benzoquinol methylase